MHKVITHTCTCCAELRPELDAHHGKDEVLELLAFGGSHVQNFAGLRRVARAVREDW